jgi:nucleotide-binding universal stress UspA family protein
MVPRRPRKPVCMILIAYDGTSCSDHAIDTAAALMHGGRAHVMHVWQPLAALEAEAAALGAAMAAVAAPLDDELNAEQRRAQDVVDAGVERARAAGFEADGEVVEAAGATAQTIEHAIDRLEPELVVIGSRGLTGLAALLKGSVSHHVSAHARTPVLVVPAGK